MSDKSELLQKIEETLPEVIGLLLAERDETAAIPEGPQAQWDLFRALVNTRPPIPASEELIVSQDRLLQGILEYRERRPSMTSSPLRGAVPYVCGVVTSRRWTSMPS